MNPSCPAFSCPTTSRAHLLQTTPRNTGRVRTATWPHLELLPPIPEALRLNFASFSLPFQFCCHRTGKSVLLRLLTAPAGCVNHPPGSVCQSSPSPASRPRAVSTCNPGYWKQGSVLGASANQMSANLRSLTGCCSSFIPHIFSVETGGQALRRCPEESAPHQTAHSPREYALSSSYLLASGDKCRHQECRIFLPFQQNT